MRDGTIEQMPSLLNYVNRREKKKVEISRQDGEADESE